MKKTVLFIALAVIVGFSVISILAGKSNNEVENTSKTNIKINEHLNLIITPDLSNRISVHTKHKAVHDTLLIKAVFENYYPQIYKSNNRAIGQKDQISFLFTAPTIVSRQHIDLDKLTINLSDFNDGERIDYLVTHTNKESDLSKDVTILKKEINRIYTNSTTNTSGADIYNFFNEELNSAYIKKNKKPIKVDQTTVYNNQRNILVLFTDGYIEAGLYGKDNCVKNSCYYLDQNKINEFRQAFIASQISDLQTFFENSEYGIKPSRNEELKNLEVIVVEMYDRSLSTSGNLTKIPSDLDIMKLFWSDWLEKSGVKKYKLFGTVNSDDEFINNIISFIED